MASNRRFAVFDLETNGFRGASVVSASSIVFSEEGHILDFFNRFYFPEERPDPQTQRVHGLTTARIAHLRLEEEYGAHFLDDWHGLVSFWEKWNPEGIVVHNLSFDTSFLPPEAVRKRNWWCSMRGLTDFCRIEKTGGPGKGWKWPRLIEAVQEAKKRLPSPVTLSSAEKTVGDPLAHYGLSDCFELYGLFLRVWHSMGEHVLFRQARAFFTPPQKGAYPQSKPCRDPFVIERLSYSSRLACATGQTEREKRLLSM